MYLAINIMKKNNNSLKTIKGFGDEWNKFDQSKLEQSELDEITHRYFEIFPLDLINKESVGFDLGCGSGRFSLLLLDKIKKLHCIEPSNAIDVAKKKLSNFDNCEFHKEDIENLSINQDSMDFGFSLGVLHHTSDPQNGLHKCNQILKPGSPFLIYLYYAFDNRPLWFRLVWRLSNAIRIFISSMPKTIKFILSEIIAFSIYFPLARISKFLENKFKVNVSNIPLSAYRNLSYYTMRTDSLDRFGTKIEKRFTKIQIKQMLSKAGFTNIKFSNKIPFWCAICYKK